MRKRKNVIIGLIASLLLVFSTTANALDIDAVFNLANSTTANAPTVNSSQDWTLDLTAGDVIAFDVFVSNGAEDVVQAVFASLVTDSTQMTFLGGAFSNILTEATCVGFFCSPATLTPGIAKPVSKPNDPQTLGTGTTEWIQAVAHTNPTGANGAGPDSAVLLAYQYAGAGGFDLVNIDAAITAGDAVAGAGSVSVSGSVINVPEPGTALLMGLGLFGLGAAGRRKS